MANPSTQSVTISTASSTNGISLAQAPGAAGNLVLNGALVTGGVATMDASGQAKRVGITSSGNETAKTFTIYGTNQSDAAISESLAGPGAAATVESKLDYKTVTRIAIDAASVGNITSGATGKASSVWLQDNPMVSSWNLAIGVHVDSSLSGPLTYTVEHSYDDPNNNVQPPADPSSNPGGYYPSLAWSNPGLQNRTDDGEFQYSDWPIYAHRLTVLSGTGKATMQSLASGIANS